MLIAFATAYVDASDGSSHAGASTSGYAYVALTCWPRISEPQAGCRFAYDDPVRTEPLDDSDLIVSRVGLGCNNFGGRIDLERAREVVDAALGAGITFFDTADI